MFCQACGTNVADGTAFCTSCGRPIVGYSVGQTGAVAVAASYPAGITASSTNYAGFWLRVVAALLDNIILTVPIAPLVILMFASILPGLAIARGNPAFVIAAFLPRLIFLVILLLAMKWLYWALMESSSWQATLGKKALGLYVTDLEGLRVSFGKASGRFWSGRGLSMVPLGNLYYLVDCICCGFTDKKQAVHDMIAGCLVMRKL
ncbi:MAG TPA: RDD family protein [Candidatus Aquilonibacter sp.]|nr:RDD family protein [Candidatus Aquilonibacter sp.]